MKKVFTIVSPIIGLFVVILTLALTVHVSAHMSSAGTRNQEVALLSNGVAIDQVTTDKVLQCADVNHVILGYAEKVMTNVPDWGGALLVNSTAFSTGMHTEEDSSHVVRVYQDNVQQC